MENSIFTFLVGTIAQLLFSARLIIQWFKSEKAGKVLSPIIFWQLSLLAAFMLLIYGIMRKDFAIMLGQIVVYFIYIRNLQLKNAWKSLPKLIRIIAALAPFAAGIWLLSDVSNNLYDILYNKEIPLALMIWGSAGQIIFTLRFLYQWYYSEHQGDSVLPNGFWVISLVGSVMILSYAITRKDPVLFAGQACGAFVYARNLMLGLNGKSLFSALLKRKKP